MSFSIEGHQIGDSHPCFIIAEVAQAHEGSLGLAHAFIDAIAETGANAVKFQTHFAEEESTLREPWRVPFSFQDKSRYDYWKRMEFSPEQWQGLRDHARQKNLVFLSTPFSLKAAQLLERLGCSAWKIGSGETEHWPLLDFIAKTKRPLLVSTGMSSWAEITATYDHLISHQADFAFFHTTTQYPTPDHQVGLNVLSEMRQRFSCPVGLSSHIPSVPVLIAAKMMGASLLELHVTFDRRMFGPDTTSSLSIDELKDLVRGIRKIESILSYPVDKDKMAQELAPLKRIFGKSIVANAPLRAGQILSPDMLGFKKPGGGLAPKDMALLIGKKLKNDVDKDGVITLEQLD